MRDAVFEARSLTKAFARKGEASFTAVDGVSFSIGAGECLGLVGGSGCGKSTVANMAAGLLEPDGGTMLLNGDDVTKLRGAKRRKLAAEVQMVFQNPRASFDPRRTLGYAIAESLRNFGTPKRQARERAMELLAKCGLPENLAERYPREVSGGQCQRAAIARALAPDPALIICDEATSALDVTVQAQIVSLLRDVQSQTGASLLFICHDLALVQGFCDRVLVMQSGEIVEEGPVDDVVSNPQSPYTRRLLDAVLTA